MLEIYDLRTEYRENPVGIDASHPRFSWKIKSEYSHAVQQSYRLLAYRDGVVVFDTGVIQSDKSQRIRYAGEKLGSRDIVQWKVQVTVRAADCHNQCTTRTDMDSMSGRPLSWEESAESKMATFEMGLLVPEDWQAEWIEPEISVDYDAFKPAPYLRRTFRVRPGLIKARIYQSAHGLYDFWINGSAGSKDWLKPGLTSYYYRIQYQVYDIKNLLHEGDNVWSVILADGWWRGRTGGTYTNNFGYKLHYIGQIELEYEDGRREIIGSDKRFRTNYGGLLMCDMRNGSIYDARLEPEDWKLPGFDDRLWRNVHLAVNETAEEDYDFEQNHQEIHCFKKDVLIASRSCPVRVFGAFYPDEFEDAGGSRILNFKQNSAAVLDMTFRGCTPGQKISLYFGEDIKDGRFNQGNIVHGDSDIHFQQIDYIARGDDIEKYMAQFTICGFQYVKIEGYGGDIQSGDFVAYSLSTALEPAGDFTCSDPLINQLVKNSRWSQISNFVDVPTDCPTRERSVWTGDAQVYCRTAADFMNVYPFFEKWMLDLPLEQHKNGRISNTCPATSAIHNPQEVQRCLKEQRFMVIPPSLAGPTDDDAVVDGSAGWGDVATILPYTMYLCYGDTQIVENAYGLAKRWTDYMLGEARKTNPVYEDEPQYHHFTDGERDADYLYDTRFHWGEWLEPDSPESKGIFDVPNLVKYGNPLVATAYMYYSCVLLAKMARITKRTEDAKYYDKCAGRIKLVYNRYYVKADGTIIEGRQAPYVRMLAMDLCTPENKDKVVHKLMEEVVKNNYKLNTGFLSTPFLPHVLAENGFKDAAFKLLQQTDAPGWLHTVKLGATTIPEDWYALDKHEASYNHYSYGAVCDFLFRQIGGILADSNAPGYKHFYLKPITGGSLTWAKTRYNSIYGEIVSEWKLAGDKIEYYFKIPENTTATIILEDGRHLECGSGEICL